jgi:NAD kinase
MSFENAIVVINKTRLESLIERFNTKAQAKFYIEHAGGDFHDYEKEHEIFHRSLESVVESVQREFKVKIIERKFVPNFLFSGKDMVVVVGQDGLVANTAKYVNELPIIGVNPDVNRYDGFLLPFNVDNFSNGWQNLMRNRATFNEVTLALAQTNDGQKLLAFNDLFVGPASHTSARYKINFHGKSEQQSSSGIIISTGAGSTGWLSSIMNMANAVTTTFAHPAKNSDRPFSLPWNTNKLAFVVREPFQSKYSSVQVTTGLISNAEKLVIESYMPSNGVVFSDGIEADFIHFNSGVKVEIGIAPQQARLVMNNKN